MELRASADIGNGAVTNARHLCYAGPLPQFELAALDLTFRHFHDATSAAAPKMKSILSARGFGTFLSLLLFAFCAIADSSSPKLPADIAINKDAGRGNLLIVPVRLQSGEELPFVVDTGTSITFFDKSLEQKLGPSVGTLSVDSWGTTKKVPLYAAPKISLGGAPLMTGNKVAVSDFSEISKGIRHPVSGMISYDCLKHYCIQLDFEAGKMRFLETNQVDRAKLGKAFSMVADRPGRPFINHVALVPGISTNALIDSGFDMDGRIESSLVKAPGAGRVHFDQCVWDGDTYTNLVVGRGDNANLLGLRFLARHLVTLDFPNHAVYLLQRSVGPLPGPRLVRDDARVDAPQGTNSPSQKP